MKRILLVLLLLMLTAPAWGQDFEKGLQAYDRGDYATALQLWRPLAQRGDAKAQVYLGGIYQDGEGVLQDFAEAARWYHMAAEQGDVGAAPVAAQHKGQMFGGAPAAFDGDTLLVKPEGAPAIRIVEIAAT